MFDLSFPSGRSVNDGIPKSSYLDSILDLAYPSVDSFVSLLQKAGPGCYMYKRDLSRAYRQLPVDPLDYKYLGFQWKDRVYFDTALPFGLRSASQACQRTTNAISFMFKELGYTLVNYIDDLAGVEKSKEMAAQAAQSLDDLIDKTGLQLSANKSVNTSQSMVFLGILFDGVNMTMAVTPERIVAIKEELDLWISKRRATKKQIQSLAGKLMFVAKCCKPGRVFMARILAVLKGLKRNNHHVYLNQEFRQDINWWLNFLPHFNSVSLIKGGEPIVLFATDACLIAGGGTHGHEFFSYVFPLELTELAKSITQLEMITVIIAVKLWASHWKGLKLMVKCDNQATVGVINSGRANDKFLQACARELVFLTCKYDFELVAQHIPGVDNILPDWLSRIPLDSKYRIKFEDATSHLFHEVFVQKDMWKFSCNW